MSLFENFSFARQNVEIIQCVDKDRLFKFNFFICLLCFSKTGAQVATKGGFQPLSVGEEEIIVDDVSEESKMRSAAEMLAGSSASPLKLKLSCKLVEPFCDLFHAWPQIIAT